MKNTSTLFALLRSVLRSVLLNGNELNIVSQTDISSLLAMAKKHDVSHLLAYGLKQNFLLDAAYKESLEKNLFTAVYRYELLNYEFNRLCDTLETAKIVFLPLKGSVIRQYYPEPWMRTSCDIDILVHEEDLENATEYLIKNLGYAYKGKGDHDVSLYAPNGVHLELHYTLLEDILPKSSGDILANIWQYTFPKNGKTYWHECTDEMFYFYHIVHMAKHIEEGGCGIKPFIDSWILDNLPDIDQTKRDVLLKQGEMLDFSKIARMLSSVWFNGAEHTESTKKLEQYILSGGVYGATKNRISIQQQRKGGQWKYALSKIFIPYNTLKLHYPILQKHRWLTPLMQIRRWCKLIFCGHRKRVMQELKYNHSISQSEAKNVQSFLQDIGL